MVNGEQESHVLKIFFAYIYFKTLVFQEVGKSGYLKGCFCGGNRNRPLSHLLAVSSGLCPVLVHIVQLTYFMFYEV